MALRRLTAFDITGIIAVLVFAVVLSRELGALRWSRQEEMTASVTAEDLAAGFREGVAWHGFYLRDAKIGFSRLEQRREGDGYHVRSHSLFDLNVMRTPHRLQLDLEAWLSSDLVLQRFTAEISSSVTNLQARGLVLGDHVEMEIVSAGIEQRSSLPINEPPSFAFNLLPALMRQEPGEGQRFHHEYFDPFSLTTRTMDIEYLGTASINIMGEDIEAYHLRQYVGGQELDAWVNELGDVLRQEMSLGVVAVRESEADATYGLGRGSAVAAADLIAAAAIPAVEVPADVQDRRRAVYLLDGVELQGFDLDGGRQRFQAAAEGIGGRLEVVLEADEGRLSMAQLDSLPAELTGYLQSEPLLQVDDSEIAETAQRCLAGLSGSDPVERLRSSHDPVRRAAAALVRWVYDNVEKTTVIGVPSASEVLRTRRGDCNEHAILTVALLRAAGIPARITSGIAYYQGSFYYHAWVEYWDGRWVSADPTWDQHPADVGHLRFVEGGLDRQIDIMRLIGTLQIRGEFPDLEARPETPDSAAARDIAPSARLPLAASLDVTPATPATCGFASIRTSGTIFRASRRRGFPAGPLGEES